MSNYHGPRNMDQLIRWGQGRTHSNKHAVFGFVGPPGSGKSEDAVLFGGELQGHRIDVKKQVAFRPKDRAPMAQRLGRFEAIIDDEASGEGGNKRRAMSAANVDSGMDLDACRGRNQYVIWAAPSAKRVDSTVWDHTMWLIEKSQNFSAKVYELVELGRVDNRYKKPVQRFSVRKMPWLGDKDPELRSEYLAEKERHMRGGSTDDAFTQGRLVDEASSLLARLLP